MRIGAVLKKWRTMSDISLRDAADSIGIHFSTLARIEGGKNPPSDALIKIAFWLFTEETNNGTGRDRGEGTATAGADSLDEIINREGN